MGTVLFNLETSGQEPIRTPIETTLFIFNHILGNNQRFVLSSNQRDVNHTFFKDSTERVLMVISYCPGQTITVDCPNNNWSSYNRTRETRRTETYRTKDKVSIQDASGYLLLTASGFRRSMISLTGGDPLMTIYCNMQTLGTLCGRNLFFRHRLIARGFLGDRLFYSQKGGSTEFTLISMTGGGQLARIEKHGVLTLLNIGNIDLRTKVLLIFASYYLYHEYFAVSRYGAIGYRGQKKRNCIFVVIGSIIVFFIVILAVGFANR